MALHLGEPPVVAADVVGVGDAIRQVEPLAVREAVVDLLWTHRHWPGTTREEYLALWDWRYGALADGEPLVWVARTPEDGGLIGHVAVFPRRFRLGDLELCGAVPGDLIIHRDHRRSLLGIRLLSLPQFLARRGVFDLVLTFPTDVSYRLSLHLGYRAVGSWRSYVDVRRAAPYLRARVGPVAALLGPLVDGLWGIHRWRHQRTVAAAARRFRVEPVDVARVPELDRSHWHYPPDRLVAVASNTYLERRFLRDPLNRRELFAVCDRRTGRLEGHVVIEYRQEVAAVCDCQVNAAALDEVTAIALAAPCLPPEAAFYVVPVLPNSVLGEELRRAGFVSHSSDPWIHASALWTPAHPRAGELARVDRWNLFAGAADA